MTMSDGMTDGYRMAKEAEEAEDREEKDKRFNVYFKPRASRLERALHDYQAKRREFLNMDSYDEKLYPGRKEELLEQLKVLKGNLQTHIDIMTKTLSEGL